MSQSYQILPRTGTSMAEEWLGIGCDYQINNKFDDALRAYANGLRLEPNNGPITCNLGVLAAQQNNLNLACQQLERSLLFDPANATAWYDYSLVCLEAEKIDEALMAGKKTVELTPNADTLTALGMILTSAGKAQEAKEIYDKALTLNPKHPLASYNTIFVRTLCETTPEDNYLARKRWYENFRWTGEKKPNTNDKSSERILKVGYVGGDFKMHSAAFIFGKVLLNHDKSKIAPYCYATLPLSVQDGMTKKFMDATTWRDISSMTDDQAEELIRKDGIDILVDLSGHTGGNRLPLFTRKPAPIQITAWGFAHGTGCPEIDYFLADPFAIPGEERKFFAEKIWDIPAIVAYLPPEDYKLEGISPAPASKNGHFTFGVFGRFEKMTPEALNAWQRILAQVPDSQILMKDLALRRPYSIRHIRDCFKAIDPKRILFATQTSHPDQFIAYQQADLILDTFPHTGGVTCLEELYMGVPIVTLYNGQVGGRTTSVALTAMGRKSWVATSIDEYVNLAVSLAKEPKELGEARLKLRDELMRSSLCNGEYVQGVEDGYRAMWKKWIS